MAKENELRKENTSQISGDSKRVLLDTTDARAIHDRKFDVALVAPVGAPRVLDKPVLLVTVDAPSDGEDSVVQRDSAPRRVKNPTLISRKNSPVCLDCDSQWLLLQGSLHLGGVVLSYGGIRCHIYSRR